MSRDYFGFDTTQAKTLQTLLAAPEGSLAANSVATASIQDSAVTNAKIAAGAAIALSKLANVAAGTDGLGAGTLQATLQDIYSDLAAAVAVNVAQATSITNLNAWATALATKLNADAGVTDVNYDTDPQV